MAGLAGKVLQAVAPSVEYEKTANRNLRNKLASKTLGLAGLPTENPFKDRPVGLAAVNTKRKKQGA